MIKTPAVHGRKAITAPATSTHSTSSDKELVIVRIAADDNLLAPQVLRRQLRHEWNSWACGGSGWLLTKLAVNSAKSTRIAAVRTMTASKTLSARLHTLAPSHARSPTLFQSSPAPLQVFSCGYHCESRDMKAGRCVNAPLFGQCSANFIVPLGVDASDFTGAPQLNIKYKGKLAVM